MINPETLQEETEEERKYREKITGVYGNGLGVKCYPTEDPSIWQYQHRAACITKPYDSCHSCQHSKFRMFFDPNIIQLRIAKRHVLVKCPQWDNREALKQGIAPDYYTNVELATCASKPFPFCASCPDFNVLSERGIDKTAEWFTRWKKYG